MVILSSTNILFVAKVAKFKASSISTSSMHTNEGIHVLYLINHGTRVDRYTYR